MIDYKKLLAEHQLWPMDTWNHFDFLHQQPSSQEESKKQIDLLRGSVTNGHGLYVYYKDGKCIYVGKAAPLFNRLKSHYYEAYRKVPGDTKNNKWHRFFSSHTGSLVVYWKQVTNETDRRIFELALTAELDPTFKEFH